METLNRTRTLAPRLIGAALVAATLSAPLAAHATKPNRTYTTSNYDYERCKKSDKENQIVGGIIGAIAGGVLGSEVAGRGDGTEGAIIGAIAGATAGAAIGDDSRNCRKETGRAYRNNTTTYRNDATYRTVGHAGHRHTQSRPYSNGYTRTTTYRSSPRTYSNSGYSRSYTTTRPYSGSRSYGYDRGYDRGNYRQDRRKLERLDYRLKDLRRERKHLKNKLEYGYDPYLKNQLVEVNYKIDRVKDKRRRIRKRLRRAEAHYHGSNVCYEWH